MAKADKQTEVFKVKFATKALAFSASVISLSWFFEGWRKIHEGLNSNSIGILSAGILCTLALLTLQAFWIYADEKQKGSLVKRVPLFDRLLDSLLARRAKANALKVDVEEESSLVEGFAWDVPHC